MKQQLIGLLGFFLLIFCFLVVIWQVFMGTRKYLDAPVANKIYVEEVELPAITICHHKHSLRVESRYGLKWADFKAGRIFPNESYNVSAGEWFEQALDENYYLLDITGLVLFCKQVGLSACAGRHYGH